MKLKLVYPARLKRKNIDWLYYPFVARGQVTIIDGDPDVGKSYFIMRVSLAICNGEELPFLTGIRYHDPVRGRVLHFDMENQPETVVNGRLEDNGGLENILSYAQVHEYFSITDDSALDEVERVIEIHEPDMVVFDTLNAYLGKINANQGPDVAATISKLSKIAEENNCAVVILRHLTKSSQKEGTALTAGSGSMQFIGKARIGCTIGRIGKSTAIAVCKANNLPHDILDKSLTFEFQVLPDQEIEGELIVNRSRIIFGDVIDLTANEIVAERGKKSDDVKAIDKGISFLEDYLKDKLQHPKSEIEAAAQAHGISGTTLWRASQKLEVK